MTLGRLFVHEVAFGLQHPRFKHSDFGVFRTLDIKMKGVQIASFVIVALALCHIGQADEHCWKSCFNNDNSEAYKNIKTGTSWIRIVIVLNSITPGLFSTSRSCTASRTSIFHADLPEEPLSPWTLLCVMTKGQGLTTSTPCKGILQASSP